MLSERMRKLPLTQGEFAIVDDDDYEWLSQFKWQVLKGRTNYARRWNPDGKPETLLMHREILGCGPDEMGDHINGNGLDNRRCNLRKANRYQSCRNSRKRVDNTSGYMGVSKHERKWVANIRVNGSLIYLGRYEEEEDAARAYDEAAKKYHGEFATINGI